MGLWKKLGLNRLFGGKADQTALSAAPPIPQNPEVYFSDEAVQETMKFLFDLQNEMAQKGLPVVPIYLSTYLGRNYGDIYGTKIENLDEGRSVYNRLSTERNPCLNFNTFTQGSFRAEFHIEFKKRTIETSAYQGVAPLGSERETAGKLRIRSLGYNQLPDLFSQIADHVKHHSRFNRERRRLFNEVKENILGKTNEESPAHKWQGPMEWGDGPNGSVQ